MNPHVRAGRRGFTLTELMMVVGLIALLLSLLMPVIGKVRAAAENVACLSNLRRMGVAWTMYTAENHGRFPEYVWHTPATPDVAYAGYWPGIVERKGAQADTFLCPSAREESLSPQRRGFGNVSQAWSGRYVSNGSAVRLSDQVYRVSSYGYNRYLTDGAWFATRGRGSCLALVIDPSNVPLFLDCAYPDVRPLTRNGAIPAETPPNLRGDALNDGSPQHWRFLLGRHGRGINVATADGGAKWVRLDDTYRLTWNGDWQSAPLRLPNN